jgi:hypothetical protein
LLALLSVSSALGRRRVREAAFGAIAVMFCDMAMPILEWTLMSYFPQSLVLGSLILGLIFLRWIRDRSSQVAPEISRIHHLRSLQTSNLSNTNINIPTSQSPISNSTPPLSREVHPSAQTDRFPGGQVSSGIRVHRRPISTPHITTKSPSFKALTLKPAPAVDRQRSPFRADMKAERQFETRTLRALEASQQTRKKAHRTPRNPQSGYLTRNRSTPDPTPRSMNVSLAWSGCSFRDWEIHVSSKCVSLVLVRYPFCGPVDNSRLLDHKPRLTKLSGSA